jgi:hypothetical protein
MSMAYRGLEALAERRLEEAEVESVSLPLLCRAYERRVARTAAGLVGLIGGVAMFGDALRLMIENSTVNPSSSGELTVLLVGAWALALPTYFVAQVVARTRWRRLGVSAIDRTGDAAKDLAELELRVPRVAALRRAAARERWSIALPMVALSLLTPLTLHLLVACAFGLAPSYGQWIAISVALVGHAHVALAVTCWMWAKRVAATPTEELIAGKPRGWGKSLAAAFVCGLVPGVVLLAVPPALVIITGLVFIPAMYSAMHHQVTSERAAIAA